MLSFPTNLANELRDRHGSAFWYIKLYYGDESSFTGLSDSDRIIDSVKYRGLVLDWGAYAHSANLQDFKPSTATLNTLTISNKDDAISGGRFSDLFSSQNYVNRKFTLHMGAVAVAFGDHIQIAQGIITDQVKQSADNLTLRLVEDISSVQVEVPTSRVNTTSHPNAPLNNIGKPIPMAFGDFGLKTDIGTVPTSGAEFDRYFVKGHFPAIITDRWSDTGAYVDAKTDSAVMSALDNKNIFYSGDDAFAACEDANASGTAGSSLLTFKGNSWRSYFRLSTWDSYDTGDYANMIDGDFSTSNTLTVVGAPGITTGFRVPKIPKLGEFTAISFMFDFGAFGGTAPNAAAGAAFKLTSQPGANDYTLTWNGGDQTLAVTAEFTTAQKDAWDFEGTTFQLIINDTGGANYDQTLVVNQVGIEIEFMPSQNFSKTYMVEQRGLRGRTGSRGSDTNSTSRIRYTVGATPEVSDYIYYSGKGREYGAWVDADSRDNGYNSGALIENPVYMIEDILRTELSLSSTEIDFASFDVAGNTTNGTIGNTFDLAVSAIEFAFCQYQFISAWDLCQELARACGCLLFFSGDGTIKIVARQRDEDYTSVDATIDYGVLRTINPDITPLENVRNKVSVKYNMDYAQDDLQTTTAEVEDSTSQGSGANGINSTQELIQDNRFTLDSSTAVGSSTALLDWLAYRKKILMFDVITPKHNDLEIGDTINFSNWPSTFKIYGNTITATDIYMITKITKKPNSCSISCQEVSEVGD